VPEEILIAVGPDDRELLLQALPETGNLIATSKKDVLLLLEKNPGISIVIADAFFS
jgi:hypothetical protein